MAQFKIDFVSTGGEKISKVFTMLAKQSAKQSVQTVSQLAAQQKSFALVTQSVQAAARAVPVMAVALDKVAVQGAKTAAPLISAFKSIGTAASQLVAGQVNAAFVTTLGAIPPLIKGIDQIGSAVAAGAKSFATFGKAVMLQTQTGTALINTYKRLKPQITTIANLGAAWVIAGNGAARYLKVMGALPKNADTIRKAMALFRFGSMQGPAFGLSPQAGGVAAVTAFFKLAPALERRAKAVGQELAKLSSEQFQATVLILANWRLITGQIQASYTALQANLVGYELIDINMARIKASTKASEVELNKFRDSLSKIGRETGVLRADLASIADTFIVGEKLGLEEAEAAIAGIAKLLAITGQQAIPGAADRLTASFVEAADALGSTDIARTIDQIATVRSEIGGTIEDITTAVSLSGREIISSTSETEESVLTLVGVLTGAGLDVQRAGSELATTINKIQGTIQKKAIDAGTVSFINTDTMSGVETEIGGTIDQIARKVAQIFKTPQGEIRSLIDILPDLRAEMDKLDPSTQGAVLTALFGESTATIRTLLQESQDDTANLFTKVSAQTGIVDIPSDIKNSYAQALSEFQSALDDLGVKISEAIVPIETFFVKFGTALLRITDTLPYSIEKLLLVFQGFVPVLTTIGTLIQPLFLQWVIWKVAAPLLLKYIDGLDRGIRAYQHLGKEQQKLSQMTQKGLRIQAQLESQIQSLQDKRLQNLRNLQKAQARADRAQFDVNEARGRGVTDAVAERDLATAQKQVRDLTKAQADLNRQIGVAERRYSRVGNIITEQRRKVEQVGAGAMAGEQTLLAREQLPRETSRLAQMQEKQQRAIAAIEERKANLKRQQVQLSQQLIQQNARLEKASKAPQDPKSAATIRDAQSRIAQLQAEQAQVDRYYQRAEQGQERVNNIIGKQQSVVASLTESAGRQGRALGQYQDKAARVIGTTIGRIENAAEAYNTAADKIRGVQKTIAGDVKKTIEGTKLKAGADLIADVGKKVLPQSTTQEIGKEIRAEMGRTVKTVADDVVQSTVSATTQAATKGAGDAGPKIQKAFEASNRIREQAEATAQRRMAAYDKRRIELDRRSAAIQKRIAFLETQPYDKARDKIAALREESARLEKQQARLAQSGQFAANRYESELKRAQALQVIEQRRLDIAAQLKDARQAMSDLDQRQMAVGQMPAKDAEKEIAAIRSEREKLNRQIKTLTTESVAVGASETIQRTTGKALATAKTGVDRLSASVASGFSTPVQNFAKGIATVAGAGTNAVKAIAADINSKVMPSIKAIAADMLPFLIIGTVIGTAYDIFQRMTKATREVNRAIKEATKAAKELERALQQQNAGKGGGDAAQLEQELRQIEIDKIKEDMPFVTRSIDRAANRASYLQETLATAFDEKRPLRFGEAVRSVASIMNPRQGGVLSFQLGAITRLFTGGKGLAEKQFEQQEKAVTDYTDFAEQELARVQQLFAEGLDPDSTAGQKASEDLKRVAEDLVKFSNLAVGDVKDGALQTSASINEFTQSLGALGDGATASVEDVTRLKDVMRNLKIQTDALDLSILSEQAMAYSEMEGDSEGLATRLADIEASGQERRLKMLRQALAQALTAETEAGEDRTEEIRKIQAEILGIEIDQYQKRIDAQKAANKQLLDGITESFEQQADEIADAADLKRLAILEDESLTAEEREKALEGAEDDLRDLQLEKTRERLKELQDLGVLSTAEEEEQRLASIEEAEDEITQLRIQKAEERAAALDEIQELESGRAEEKLDAEKELQEEIAQGRIDLQDELFQNEKEFALEQQKEREEFELDLQERRADFQKDQQKAQADFEKQQQEEKAQFEKDLQKELEDLRKSEEERIIDQAIEREKELALAKSEAERAELRKKYKEEDEQRAKELEAELKASEEVEKNRSRILSDAEKAGVLDVELSATELRRQGEEQAQKEAEFAQQQLDAAEEFKAQQEQEALDFEQEIQDSQAEFEQGQRDAEIEFLESQRQLQLDFENESRQQWADFWNEQRKLDRDNAEAIAKIREREGIATRLEQLQGNMAAQERQKKIYESYLNAAATNTDPNVRYDPASLERARGWIAQSEAAIKAIADQVAAEQQRMGQIDAELNAADQRPTLATLDEIAMSEREVELREQQAAERAATQDFNAQERERDAQHRAEQRRLDRENAEQIYSIYNQPGNIVDLGGLPARREGGPVAAGQTYLVGEEGPELFTPGRAGGILPADQTAALMGGLLSNRPNIYAPTPATESLRELQQIRKALSGLKPGVGSQQISIRNSYQPDGGSTAAMVERSQLDLLRQLQKTLG